MDFRLLGPFEARHDGAVAEVGGRRQERCLLAVLLLELGGPVPTDRLADLLWNGRPPASARGTLHTYIGRLRAALAPYQVQIVTRGDGYLVEACTHQVDVAEFRRTAHPTREQLIACLMTALYRGARQADALQLYRSARESLVARLGVEPGPRLQRLHRRILRNDHRLDQPRRVVYEVRLRDESLPWSVGGHPALEFCNTYAGWGHEPRCPVRSDYAATRRSPYGPATPA